MDLGAFIFVPALVGCVIFGFVFALFASHYYLGVLQITAAGARQVSWPAEPILDSFWKVFYMAWLIGLWLGPAWFISRAFSAGPDHAWLRYAVPLAVFWICYPVSQMSSLSGPSIWLPLHHDVFGRLARKPGLVISFLAISGFVLAALGLGFHLTFFATGVQWLFIGTPLFIASALLYGRLLGRLAFALMYTRSILTRRKKKKPREDDSTESKPVRAESASESPFTSVEDDESSFVQPSELPPIRTPDEGDLHGYNVSFEDAKPKRPKKRVRAEAAGPEPGKAGTEPPHKRIRPDEEGDDDLKSYGVHEPEVEPEDRAPAEVVKPSEMEMRLLNRDDAPKPPKQVWTAEIFTFVFHPDTLVVIGLLSVMCVMVGGMVRIARAFNPASSG